MTRRALRHWLPILALAAVVAVTLARVATGAPEHHTRTVGHGQTLFDGHGPEWWARAYRRDHHQLLTLQRQHRQLRVYAVRLRRRLQVVRAPAASSGGGYSVPGWFRQQALCIYSHENGGYGWAANTGNGFYGGLQFTQDTWERAGGTGNPADATTDEQIYRAYRIVTEDGGSWREWPTTSRMCGLA